MALNSIQLCGDIIEDHTLKSIYSAKEGAVMQCRQATFDSSNGSIISSVFRKKKPQLSPYLQSDRPPLLSHYMDKKFHKQKRFPSSFPLAVNLYKANSDEFKLKKQRGEKNKKSVLTLPNEPIAQPQSCTVSDMNDSEYFNSEKKKKPRKKVALHKKKIQRGKNFEFVDRDAKYCSQVNIDLDCSSTDTIKRLKCFPKNKCHDVKMRNDEELQPHDVWAVLRNINRFQFRPSPAISEDSLPLSPRKKKPTKRNKRKTARVFETCRTEEYAYTISNINDVECKSNHSSSIDRITVIEGKGEDLSENKSIKQVSKELKLPKKPRSNKAHNRLKLLSSPKVTKNELSTNIGAELGCCRMVKNNHDNLITVRNCTKSQDSKDFSTPTECSVDSSWQVTTEVEVMHSSFSNFSKEKVSNTAQFQESHKFNGSTKLMLSKGRELASSKREASPRKARLVTTMPSVNYNQPKLTQTDIRRRLANIKFPIVILGKDQLSGTIEVQQDIYSQFDGLDTQIWPFMVHWSDNANLTLNSDGKDKKPNNIAGFHPAGTKKPTNFLVLNKQYLKIKKPPTTDISLPCPKLKENKLLTTNNGTTMQSEFNVKTKPIRQLRDKMLKLLYKKSSSSIAKDMPTDGGQGDVENKHIPEKPTNNKKNYNGDKAIDNYSKPTTYKSSIRPVPVPTPPSNLFAPKQQWGKAKWASSFIDNVMKKIRAGVYYTQDNSVMDSKSHNGSKEISIQVGVPLNSIGINVVEGCDDFTPKITMQKKREALAYLPGFDDDLPQIEIESMTRNQLTVKHCVTNVMLQFDVCVPSEQEQGNTIYKRSMSFVPLTITESKTKVYKCKAKIFNAMLPAEICSILPKLMNKLENPDTNLALTSMQKTSVDTFLSTITELSGSEIVDTLYPVPFSIPLIPQINMSPELRIIANGAFPIKVQQPSKCRKYSLSSIDMPSLRKLLPKPKIHAQHYLQLTLSPLLVESKINRIPSELHQKQVPNSCTGLVRVSPMKSPALSWDSSKYAQTMMKQMLTQVQRWIPAVFLNFNSADITVVDMNPLCNKITVGLKSNNPNQISNTVSLALNELNLESLYNAVMPSNHTVGPSSKPVKSIKNLDKPRVNKVENKGMVHNIHKHKKKTFVTRYTKCKSTSNISVEKSGSTALSKITNMENFFQALGTNKLLADAYDGYSSRKILAFIIEMKTWITEISPRQALLILLLSNKKDTSNLVRFRPVILQGIAVNRITRTSELDMEIEVIERESFNKLSELNGTLAAPRTVMYDDNLLEELYWIAKTTASDYQRTFDESSEKLLKALLEKRKRLNPSYLRVMARYVGLGLLKSSPKN